MFFIRDAAGTSAEKQGAHGSAFDRVAAFQFGFSSTPARCARIDEAEIRERITQQPFSPDDPSQGQLPIDRKSLDLLESSLRDAYKQTGAAPPAFKEELGGCADGGATSPVAYCPGTNQVLLDLGELAKIGAVPRKGQKGGLGDFAAFAEIASRFALSIQKATGYALDGPAAGLRTACLTGAWAGTTTKSTSKLRLSAGDLDEAVGELLADKSLIAADVNGVVVPSGFARVEAFRDGFLDGMAGVCTRKYS
jgi:predicted metalloprotease